MKLECRVSDCLHWNIHHYFLFIKTVSSWYEHEPEPVVDGIKMTIPWDIRINTDQTILTDLPGIIILDERTKTRYSH